ncbi:MAG: ABC transporter substrate-binding protein [Gemmatimonadaceae bacterium]
MTQIRLRSALQVAAVLAVVGCRGSESSADDAAGAVGGTLVIAAAGEPEHLAPPIVQTLPAKQVVDQVFEGLAALGPESNRLGVAGFIPRVADRWLWSADSSSIDFVLDTTARFHDGRPVTAADVKFSYDLYMDPSVASPHVASFPSVDSLVAVDSTMVRVYFAERSPERFFKLVTNLLIVPRHLLATVDRAKLAESEFAQHPGGTGPYRFVKWERGARLALAAAAGRARGRAGMDRVFFRYMADLNVAAQSVTAGEADFVELLRPQGMALVTADAPVRTVEYPSSDHGYVLFNTRSTTDRRQPHPLFGDRGLRIALAMAIDRHAVIGNALDSLARLSFGPFQRSSWAGDTTIAQIPHDVAGARRMLDSLGWRDANGDGVRERNGSPLRFTLLVPSVSATRRQMAVVVQEQLKQVGVDAVVDGPEPAALFPRLTQGKFDAFIHVWHVDATPSGIGQVWGGSDLERSANYGWYANPTVDSLIALAVKEPNRDRARALYRRIYETIVLDAPAVFLWEPRTFALAHKRVKFSGLRGDAWWSGIPVWRIPEGERIARDRMKASE